MNKKIICSASIALLVLTTACSSQTSTLMKNEQTIQVETNTTSSKTKDPEIVIISAKDHKDILNYLDKIASIIIPWDQSMINVQDTINNIVNDEIGEAEATTKCRISSKELYSINNKLNKINPPILESETLTQELEDFSNNMLLTTSTAEDAVNGIVKSIDTGDVEQLEKATKLWDRAVDYYDNYDENLDRLQKRAKDWKNYQSAN